MRPLDWVSTSRLNSAAAWPHVVVSGSEKPNRMTVCAPASSGRNPSPAMLAATSHFFHMTFSSIHPRNSNLVCAERLRLTPLALGDLFIDQPRLIRACCEHPSRPRRLACSLQEVHVLRAVEDR